ncbi:MAG: glucose-1-phosphate adenylyltransferase subunit GlgD [Christensenellaceae bacterium]|jgi:glucose-1-phosphate adenylyltransferase|nr:glucose-1-phosphate adenylyltransferase subunit GlgD [Christensenellaceae bacterium]
MNNKMMGILFASGNESKLNELTIHRTTASLPFGGRYRLIDFTLSNLVNSGVTRIGIITRSNYSSLMDHIRMGRDWDLNRKNSGIAVFPPFVLNTSRDVYKGKIEAIYTITDFINRSPEDYVIVANCNIAANIDFTDVLENHIESGADITMLCHNGMLTSSRRVVIAKNAKNRVTDIFFVENPSQSERMLSLNAYILRKEKLVSYIENAYARGHVDFEKDVLFAEAALGSVNVYEVPGYASIIDDVKMYYTESMKLLDYDIREQLFGADKKIYTKVKDSIPTKYGKNCYVKNSLIADGCTINGSVENSILFRNVRIQEGASVKDSIIMEDGEIMEGSTLSYAITDKSVTIKENRQISGFSSYPIVIVKNKVV